MEPNLSLLSLEPSMGFGSIWPTTSPGRLDLIVDHPQDLNHVLDKAVQRIIPSALERRKGILVTQILPNKYIVEVDDGVPCGVIHEKRVHPGMYTPT